MTSAQESASLAVRSRMMHAWTRAHELVTQSRRMVREVQSRRESKLRRASPSVDDGTVWKSDDGAIRCRLIPHALDDHEVVVVIEDRVVWSRSFADPVEAADESERARSSFLADSESE